MPAISENLDKVREQIASAAARAGRTSESIQLVAVSKSHPDKEIRDAIDSGQLIFGESRIQEAKQKVPLLSSAARWHFIGHLQKNKVRQALPLFELIHGVDSLELAREIDRIAAEEGLFPRVLLQVNVAGESSKHGFSPDHIRVSLPELLKLARVEIHGVMTIPPLAPAAEMSRPCFATLRKLRDELERESGAALPELSMGMSGDFEVAIEEGATLVRVGTAIFGPRQSRPSHQ